MKAKFEEEQIIHRVDVFTVVFILLFIVFSFGYVSMVYFKIGVESFKAKPAVTDEKKLPACSIDNNRLVKKNDDKKYNALPEQIEFND